MGQPKAPPTHEKRMAALGRILQTLREEEQAEKLASLVLDYVAAEFQYSLLWIGLYDRINHKLIAVGATSPKPNRFLKQTITLQPGDLLEQVVIQQRLALVPDLRAETRAGEWAKTAEALEIQGAMLLPIRYQNTCFGVMLLGSPRWGNSASTGERAQLSIVLGTYAEALHQFEIERQRQQIKRPDRPLFSLLERLDTLEGLDERLEAVISETHSFVAPSRTSVYWFHPEEYCFWLRISNRHRGRSATPYAASDADSRLRVEEIRGVYQMLSNRNLVVIGDAEGSLTTNVSGRLMDKLGARSLLAAPILCQNEVQGFLTVEGDEPRIWTDTEKQYLQGVARLLGLSLPRAEFETTLSQTKADQHLLSGVVRSIHDDKDWRTTLEFCATELCQRLTADRLLVLMHDADRGGYEVCFQTQATRAPRLTWRTLDDIDWQMLERSKQAISIENLDNDLKLMAWRSNFQDLGVRSLIVCNVSLGHPPEGLVILASHQGRHWTQIDLGLMESVSQQVGLILHQWQLQRQVNQQGQVYETIHWGLRNLQRTFQTDQLQQASTHHIAQLLRVPLVALVGWRVGGAIAHVADAVIREKDFAINLDHAIPVSSDAIVNWALQADGALPLNFEDLPDATRQWISGPTGSKLVVMALQTAPEHIPSAVLVLMDRSDRRWSEYHLNLLTLLVNQLAWSRRHLSLMEMLLTQRDELEQLNWYKQRRFEEVFRHLEGCIRRLNELSLEKDGPAGQHYQQVLRQLGALLTTLTPLVKYEHWQFHSVYETTPLISLLSRLNDRVNPLVQKHQLWTKVHNDNNVIIGGDIPKMELVLYELLSAACQRSSPGSRIDIWCRLSEDHKCLEVSITDNGELDAELLEELHSGRPDDSLAPSPLDEPPGLHFAICQSLMQQIGCAFNLFRLEDNRILSRVMLPIASAEPTNSIRREGPTSQPFSRKHGR